MFTINSPRKRQGIQRIAKPSSTVEVWKGAINGDIRSHSQIVDAIKALSYSNTIVYNNFPTDVQRKRIEQTVRDILDVRQKYPESSFGDLYHDTLMPTELRRAHQNNDRAVM